MKPKCAADGNYWLCNDPHCWCIWETDKEIAPIDPDTVDLAKKVAEQQQETISVIEWANRLVKDIFRQ